MGSERKRKIKEMREICSPAEKERNEVAIERLFYIKVGFIYTRLLVRTRMTPNQITVLWGSLVIFFSLLFLFDDPYLRVIGAVGWILSYPLDNTDGQIARYKGMCSRRGVFLDQVNHCLTWPVLFFCVGLGEFFVSGEIFNVIFGTAAGVFMALTALIMDTFKTLENAGNESTQGAEGGLFRDKRRFRQLMSISPLTFVNIYPIILVATLLGMVFTVEFLWMTSFVSMLLLFYGAAFPLVFLTRVAILYKKLD